MRDGLALPRTGHPLMCTVYWPAQCTAQRSGYIVGWNVGGLVASVACVVCDVSVSELQRALGLVAQTPSLECLWRGCGARPVVLGRWSNPLADAGANELDDEERADVVRLRMTSGIWLTMECKGIDTPIDLCCVHCVGYQYTDVTGHLVVYDPLDAHTFLSATPVTFDHTRGDTTPTAAPIPGQTTTHPLRARIEAVAREMLPLTLSPPGPLTRPSTGAPTAHIVTHINASQGVTELVALALALGREARASAGTVSESGVSRGASAGAPRVPSPHVLTRYMLAVIQWLVFAVEWPWWGRDPDSGLSLLHVSRVARQLRHRLRVLGSLGVAWESVRGRHNKSVAARVRYLERVNALLLVAVDFALGVSAIMLFWGQGQLIIETVHRMAQLLTGGDVLSSHLMWLMGWPAGFKLNANLDAFLGHLFMSGARVWRSITDWLSPLNIYFFYAVVGSASCGLTMMLAVASDLLAVTTLHVYVFYQAAAVLYRYQLMVMSSLWLLFRGKKYNPLRHRIDTCHYDHGQLLLGTILFTILFFLFPTVVVYYTFFMLARVAIVAAQLALAVLISLLSHLPVFPLIVRLVQPQFLPGSIHFHPVQSRHLHKYLPLQVGSSGSGSGRKMCYFALEQQSVPLAIYFSQYQRLLASLNLDVGGWLAAVIRGTPIPTPPHLQCPLEDTVK